MVRAFFITALILLLCFPVFGQESSTKQTDTSSNANAESKSTFYDRSQKPGWWWYKDYKKEKQEEQKKEASTKQPKTKSKNKEQQSYKPLKEYTYEELLYMHPDEFAKLYDYYLKKAVQKPTEESVYEFYNVQDVARKKALLFANISGYVWQKYPDLSTERDVPIVGPGITQKRK